MVMLHLLSPTDPSWVEQVSDDLSGLLSDHAHCELKAAQSALSLIGRHGCEAPELIKPLSALAQEETAHFRAVSDQMKDRGIDMAKPQQDAYVRELRKAARVDPTGPILLDRLLVAAMIEARSCERFKLLADALSPPALAEFYRGLMASEARHFTIFSGLAESLFGPLARERLRKLAKAEGEIAASLPLGPTVHG